jgi:hypothetical protein
VLPWAGGEGRGWERTATGRRAGAPASRRHWVAKSYKIHDRIEAGIEDRTYDKDASDIVRIMQSVSAREMAAALAELRANSATQASTKLGMTYLEELFGRRNGEGIAMAIRALRVAMPEERVRAICLAYSAELRAAP